MSRWKSLGLLVLGNVCLAAAVGFLIVPNEILTGGVAGVSIALYPLFHIPVVSMINILTIFLYLVGCLFLGKEFAIRTLVSTIIYPVLISTFTWIAAHDFPEGYFIMEPWIASAYGGALAGAGLGIVFRTKASTGGMDIPALILAKYTPISESNAVLIVDSLTVCLGVYTYGLQAALIGLISVFISAWMIDRVIMFGSQSAQNVFIISKNFEAVQSFILKDISRGVTRLDGVGAYTDTPRPVLMCVISKRQYPPLEEGVLKIDPTAFIIVNPVHSVHGEGFGLTHGTI